jgi:hypothetical protein
VAAGIPAWVSVVVFVPALLLIYLTVSLITHIGAGNAATAITRLLAH